MQFFCPINILLKSFREEDIMYSIYELISEESEIDIIENSLKVIEIFDINKIDYYLVLKYKYLINKCIILKGVQMKYKYLINKCIILKGV
jgi:hypothetical protein